MSVSKIRSSAARISKSITRGDHAGAFRSLPIFNSMSFKSTKSSSGFSEELIFTAVFKNLISHSLGASSLRTALLLYKLAFLMILIFCCDSSAVIARC